MNLMSTRATKVKKTLYGIIFSVCFLYVGQIFIYHYRFHVLDAIKITPHFIEENCDNINCTAKYTLEPQGKFLLLGHVMRYHSLYHNGTGQEVFPISTVRGVANESWTGLRIYPVSPGESYLLSATKPKAVFLDYFMGILPRSTDHEGILSVPDISPTVSTISTLLGFGILGILLFAAFMAPITGADARQRREDLIVIGVCVFFASIVALVGTGIVDSLLPDGELRSRVLRTSLVMTAAIYPLAAIFSKLIQKNSITIILSITIVSFAINIGWSHFKAGEIWIITSATMILGLSIFMLIKKRFISSLLIFISLYDPLFMSGIIKINDIPPLYLLMHSLIASYSLIFADLGGVSVIALAARAYHRFTREISLGQITTLLNQRSQGDLEGLPEAVKNTLPRIAQLTGAGRVSILMNLPMMRPIFHSLTTAEDKITTHDDGKIPGAVTVRSFVYGDEAWFEKYQNFAERLGIPTSPHLADAEYVCVAPIRVNNTNMGVLMLTSFDDEYIERLMRNHEIEDEKETCRMVVDTLAAAFSEVVIQNMASHASLATELLSKLREAIPASHTTESFLESYCQAIFEVTGFRVMLHHWQGERGVGVAQGGFTPGHWQLFAKAPFNLSSTAQKAYGATVVAFREQKASYLKDWQEISDKLHPKTVTLLGNIETRSFLAVPLRSAEERYVVTMLSRREGPSCDHSLIPVIQSTEAIFEAAVIVLQQRSSVLALGKLANRLIGDDDVREQIIEAAKQEQLPTTIGRPRTSFLFLIDLMGSSQLRGTTEEKARSYGLFYDEVNRSVREYLGGKIRKTIGDAIIVTWDGMQTRLEDQENLLTSLCYVVEHADAVAQQVGCGGVRAVMHYGDYFFGLIGTSSFGQIDVIGQGIDEVCKLEGYMKEVKVHEQKIKLIFSREALERLPSIDSKNLRQLGFIEVKLGKNQQQSGWGIASIQIANKVQVS